MKHLRSAALIILIFASLSNSLFPFQKIQKGQKTVILVRHAEKEKEPANDPSLNPDGKERAAELAYLLKDIALDAVHSTPYKRTRETALPSARLQGLDIQSYNSTQEICEKIKNSQPGSIMLVVGHSNTIPDIINHLLEESIYPHLGHNQYDNLYMVTIPESGKPEVYHLHFGRHSE